MDMLTWLADALRTAGLAVVEEPGWQERGLGSMVKARGVMLHHTAGPLKGNSPSLALVRDGRPDLRGPLSHLFLARDGTFHVLAAGRCNHAGTGTWQGITAGNSSFIGIEAENAGTGKDPWPQAQMVAYERGVAALLNHLGEDAVMACGHKEYALPRGRKIDPAFDMVTFRENVETIMANRETLDRMEAAAPVDPKRDMLRKGSQGTSVSALQRALGILADGAFGPKTVAAVKAYQTLHGLTADGIVGPKTWKALGF